MTESEYSEFKNRVYDIVSDIPPGYVLTYGMLAFLAERPRNARMVGKIISQAPEGLPSYRVVNHMGRTAPGWPLQRKYLENEGVTFKANNCVNLKKHLWSAT